MKGTRKTESYPVVSSIALHFQDAEGCVTHEAEGKDVWHDLMGNAIKRKMAVQR